MKESAEIKSIFILGASRLQVPAIKKAKEKGLYVYALDYDSNAVGIQYADRFLEISTIDKEAVYKAAIEYKPDYIITSTSDMPVRTVSWVNEKLGRPSDISYEGSICATDKVAMRNRMKEFGVPIPEFHAINSIGELINVAKTLPPRFVLKPADNAASRGVILVNSVENTCLEEKYNYCKQYSRSGIVLAEEYMEGAEVSVEAFSIGGEPQIITVTDKMVSAPPFFVELGHTQPSRYSKEYDNICSVAEAAIRAIGIKNGPSHTEIKVTQDGAKLVEIAARLGGDFITSRLVPLSTGVDMIECSFASLLGERVLCEKKYSRGAAVRFIRGETGILRKVCGVEEAVQLPGVQAVEIYKMMGERINNVESSNDRVGHIIAIGKDADEATVNAERALDKIMLEIE